MSVVNKNNLKKTLYYIQRNGIKKTWFAVWERLFEAKKQHYTYREPDEALLCGLRESGLSAGKISILVPAYETKPEYLAALIESVLAQTYSNWELVIADASRDYSVQNDFSSGPQSIRPRTIVSEVVRKYDDERISYHHLAKNYGIAGNTNAGLAFVNGEYTALLDHDDLLTKDALSRMASAIETYPEGVLFYSDEDKCNGDASEFFEPNYKRDFDKEQLLTNNYLCHLSVFRTDVLKQLRLSEAYEGSQDFKLVLDVLSYVEEKGQKPENYIIHVPYVLYHWRWHTGSTAANPKSKQYAYEMGRKAIQDYCDAKGYHARVTQQEHVGHYYVEYEQDEFTAREEFGAVCNYQYKRGRIAGGPLLKDGSVEFLRMRRGYLGYMCLAASQHTVAAATFSSMTIRPSLEAEVLAALAESGLTDDIGKGQFVCTFLQSKGYKIVCDPRWHKTQPS